MRRAARAVVLTPLFFFTACTSFQAQRASPSAATPQDFPRTVRLSLVDGSVRLLRNARLAGDSIHGDLPDRTKTAVATAQVRSWEARKVDAIETFLLVLVAVGAVAVVVQAFLPPDVVY